eukprot:TRINITY_DN8362_c0_g1_i2.p1 TRINITY_DN8362_c0_g1~~TRINITY_DN8362_c0_g1_i2.p1  ORF type:complete len:235 (+),score=54.89 TRINITY_DN8362_c0_g1_i2:533-1237(+)
MASGPRWLPLESNPEVMNKFVREMGLKGDYEFTDIFGLDPELLAMVPQPVAGVLLLFPLPKDDLDFNRTQAEEISAKGQQVSDKVFYMKQTIGNACGTIGLLHCLGNNQDIVTFDEGSYLHEYYGKVNDQTPAERGATLEQSDGIGRAHEASCQEGQTQAPELDAKLDLHFICFVVKDGCLYELDGRKEFPINHGPSSTESILNDTAAVVKSQFMARSPDDLRFTLVAFAKKDM